MTSLAQIPERVEDPLQEVQALQRDLKSFARAVNKPLRDHVIYPLASPDTQKARRALPSARSSRDEELVERLKLVKALPGKSQTAVLVRQALSPQDENKDTISPEVSPSATQRQRKPSAALSMRQQAAHTPLVETPTTAVDFQDQLYDASGEIDLTRVKLKIQQHQQDLIAAGLHVPLAELELSPSPEKQVGQGQAASKLRWQSAAGQQAGNLSADYTLSQHERRSAAPKVWIHKRKMWEEDEEQLNPSQENVLQSFTHSPSLSPDQLLRHQSTVQLQRIQGLLHQAPGQPPGHPETPGPFQQSARPWLSQTPERAFNSVPTFAQPRLAQMQSTGRLLQQPSLPKAGSSHPLESRLDNSEAAHRALLSEEADRMLRHVSADGTSCQAGRLLRTPEHLTPLIAACQTAQDLQTLDLSHNSLSDTALPQLEGLVNSGVRLTSLDLSHNQLKLIAAAPLTRIIAGAVMQQVSPSRSSISHQSSSMSPVPSGQDSRPATQDQSSDWLQVPATSAADQLPGDSAAQQSGSGDEDAAPSTSGRLSLTAAGAASAAAAGIPGTTGTGVLGPSLQYLALSHNPLGDHGMKALAGCVDDPSRSALIQLALEKCNMGALCSGPLGAILQTWTSLRQLTLSWNDLGLRGASTVAQALQANQNLLTLELAHCGLTDMGGAQIALSLAANRSLRNLDLSSNQLEGATCAALSHVLPADCHLDNLWLDKNPLGKQGAVMVLQAVAASTSSTLQQLQLLGCGLTDTAFIYSAIQQRAADALAQAKTPKKKKKAKKKGAKGKEPADDKKKGKKQAPAAATPAPKPGTDHYSLQLEKPSDWATALGLIQAARSGKLAWKNLMVAGKKKAAPVPPEQWPAEMPTSGTIEFDTKLTATKPEESAAADPPLTPQNGFCTLLGDNLGQNSQALDDWRLQLLELLPAAKVQLSETQALKLARQFPGLLEGLLRSEDQHRALTALGSCCKQLPVQLQLSTPHTSAALS